MGEADREADVLDRWLTGEGRRALDALTSGTADVLGVMDTEFVIRYVNWTAPGLTREQVIGGSIFALVPPGYADVARACFERVLRRGEPDEFEMMYPGVDGWIIWKVRVGPIMHGGVGIGAFTVNSDVTEERRGSADRDRFFSLSLDMLMVIAPDTRLKRVNPAFCETLGYEGSELVGKSFLDFVLADDAERTQSVHAEVLKGTPVADFENRYRRKDGTSRVFSWRATVDPITGDVYAVARDITEQRATETRLRHAQKMEAVGQLAGGVAHDFNNLMQAVLANAELARMPGGVSPRVEQHLREIEAAGLRAAELTKQLLTFSRRQPLHRAPVDLDELIRGMQKLLERLIPESITIDIVTGASQGSVNADRTQLEQVILNLCVNARDAMDRGGRLTLETAHVVIGEEDCLLNPWARPGAYVRLSVTDTGAGMSAEVRERAFDPFFTTKGDHGGTGLGLATVYGIVQQHDGLVNVYSEPDLGTTFKIYLPSDDRAPTAQPLDIDDASSSLRGNETILLAEDGDLVRSPVIQVLEGAGYRTLAVGNGREAVRMLIEHRDAVDLALLDVVMPELGGPETWAELREIQPSLRVVFMSGYADSRSRERLPVGSELLEKPFRTQELLRRVRRELDR